MDGMQSRPLSCPKDLANQLEGREGSRGYDGGRYDTRCQAAPGLSTKSLWLIHVVVSIVIHNKIVDGFLSWAASSSVQCSSACALRMAWIDGVCVCIGLLCLLRLAGLGLTQLAVYAYLSTCGLLLRRVLSGRETQCAAAILPPHQLNRASMILV